MAYEVFISYKRTPENGRGTTRDYQLAADLHRTLTEKGVKVFFSERDLSTSAFVRELYQALDEAKILIVVGTKPEHVVSEWVRAEWETFLTAIFGKRKLGAELYTYLEGMSVNLLPLELYNRHSFTSGQKDELVARVLHNLGKQPSGGENHGEGTSDPVKVAGEPIREALPVQQPATISPSGKSPSGTVNESGFKKVLRTILPGLKIFGIQLVLIMVLFIGLVLLVTLPGNSLPFVVLDIFAIISFGLVLLVTLLGNSLPFVVLDIFAIISLMAFFALGIYFSIKWCESTLQKILTVLLLPSHWYLLWELIGGIVITYKLYCDHI